MHTPEDGIIQFAKRRPDWELRSLHQGLMLSNVSACLDTRTASTRKVCPKCGKSRALYCYDCIVPLLEHAPRVTLPFHLSILTHSTEMFSKNTGVQAALLAPDQVTLHSLDACPIFERSRAVVLYPSDDAINIEQLEPNSVDHTFIIDSKWKESKDMIKHPALSGVRRVKLTHARSAFWRFHTSGVGEEGLCTIECLYFFLKELVELGKITAPSGSIVETCTSRAGATSEEQGGHTSAVQLPGTNASQSGGADRACAVPCRTEEGVDASEWVPRPQDARCDPHAYDDLLWYFSCQHNYVSKIAAQRLEEHKAKKAQKGQESLRQDGTVEVDQHMSTSKRRKKEV